MSENCGQLPAKNNCLRIEYTGNRTDEIIDTLCGTLQPAGNARPLRIEAVLQIGEVADINAVLLEPLQQAFKRDRFSLGRICEEICKISGIS